MSMPIFRSFEALAATAGHIETVQATLDRLTSVKLDAWEQLLASAARLYRAGEISPEQLLDLHNEMRDSFGTGYSKVWNAIAPIPHNKLAHVVERRRRDKPNGPLGSWFGTFPLFTQPTPPEGVCVVYVLFDDTNEPVYVGSTQNFRLRMADHRANKPRLASWTAYPCRDREHAYQLEVELLRQHKPRMNRKRGR